MFQNKEQAWKTFNKFPILSCQDSMTPSLAMQELRRDGTALVVVLHSDKEAVIPRDKLKAPPCKARKEVSRCAQKAEEKTQNELKEKSIGNLDLQEHSASLGSGEGPARIALGNIQYGSERWFHDAILAKYVRAMLLSAALKP